MLRLPILMLTQPYEGQPDFDPAWMTALRAALGG